MQMLWHLQDNQDDAVQVGAQSANPAACASNVRGSLGCAAPPGNGQRCQHHVQLAVYVRLPIPVRKRRHSAAVHGRPLECQGPWIGALLHCSLSQGLRMGVPSGFLRRSDAGYERTTM